jgi:hypothetical protein
MQPATSDPYQSLPEPLRSIARDNHAGETRQLRGWGSGLLVSGVGLAGYLAYYVLHRASFGGDFNVRGSEIATFVVGLLLAAGGGYLWMLSMKPDAQMTKLASPGITIVDCGRLVNKAGRWLRFTLSDGTEIRWRLGGMYQMGVDERAEVAAVRAVQQLPQWAPGSRPVPGDSVAS